MYDGALTHPIDRVKSSAHSCNVTGIIDEEMMPRNVGLPGAQPSASGVLGSSYTPSYMSLQQTRGINPMLD